MTKDLSPKKEALKKLLALAEDGSFDIYETTGDIYGERAWPVECLRPLCELKHSKTMTCQKALDETLMRFAYGDFPKTVKDIEKEERVIRLVLQAGANPNYSKMYSDGLCSVFKAFWNVHKSYGMLELVQDKRFTPPIELQEFYEGMYWYPKWTGFDIEKQQVHRQENKNRADLIYTLFQKNMLPTNPQVFEKLLPVILERDPQFFDKKKQIVQRSLERAKTPIQIYSALMGKGKEKE